MKCQWCNKEKENSLGLCPNCNKFPSWRKEALKWWGNLGKEEKEYYFNLWSNKRPSTIYSKILFETSPSKIEECYKEEILKIN